jgi:hypothetical protein
MSLPRPYTAGTNHAVHLSGPDTPQVRVESNVWITRGLEHTSSAYGTSTTYFTCIVTYFFY